MRRRQLAARALVGVASLLALAAPPASVEAACTVSVQGGVSFGTYNVFAPAPLDSTGSIAYRCDAKDHDIRITISRGSSPTYRPRTLQSGGEHLDYNLYTDAARTEIWGDQTEGTGVYYRKNPPNANWITLTVYGRIGPGMDAAAGSYSDSVTVEINF